MKEQRAFGKNEEIDCQRDQKTEDILNVSLWYIQEQWRKTQK